jgi:hypothetical protein
MIAGVLCQRKPPPIERWFKFDGNLLNSGSLPFTAAITSGSVSYSSSNANTGQSVIPSDPIITTSPLYALGTDFYVEFYATWTDDSIFNTVISSTTNGINIAKTGYDGGKIRIDVAGVPVITSIAAYGDGTKRKFKVSFVAGAVSLYVDDVLTDTGTTATTDFDINKSDIRLLGGTGGGAQSGYYDDLIIQRF